MTVGALTPGGSTGLVDTHLHLQDLPDPLVAADEAVAAGVGAMIAMGVNVQDSRAVAALAASHPAVYAAVGHHPLSSDAPDWEAIRQLAVQPRVVALGEVGLDGAHTDQASLATQIEWFHRFCDLSVEIDLPLSIHTREAEAEVHQVLAAHPGVRGVIHYFSLSWDWAERFLGLGLHLSFSGLVTRPSRGELREVVRRCPPGRLLLETDSPYGTPHMHRGQTNRPAWMLETARLVADLREVSLDQVARLQGDNVRGLFPGIVW